MSQDALAQARSLIKGQRFDEARELLETIRTNPSARMLLDKLDDVLMDDVRSQRGASNTPDELAIFDKAKELIKDGKYSEAKAVLELIEDNLTAQSWISRLDARLFEEKAYRKSMSLDNPEGKNWGISIILCVLFGYLGFHRFYTGHIGIGLIQMFTGGGLGIWWLIDLVMIITRSYRDSNGNKLV